VPIAYDRQAPLPLQVPSVPQLDAPWSAHWFKGSCPAGTAVQTPGLPASAHDRHVPVQVVVQQTPCSHRPELHSGAVVHAVPMGFLPQLPIMQLLGGLQSAFDMHIVRHAPLGPHT
jgi:hypothetical protein